MQGLSGYDREGLTLNPNKQTNKHKALHLTLLTFWVRELKRNYFLEDRKPLTCNIFLLPYALVFLPAINTPYDSIFITKISDIFNSLSNMLSNI